MYATISFPVESRTRTHFRFAELGFFGFLTRVFNTTPLAKGFPSRGFKNSYLAIKALNRSGLSPFSEDVSYDVVLIDAFDAKLTLISL